MRAGDVFKNNPALHMLVYGDSGSGKSTWAARSPRPFIALTEPQGLASIAEANPDADVEMIETFDHWRELYAAINKGAPVTVEDQPAFKFDFRGVERVCQTFVLDSLSDLNEHAKVKVVGSSEAQPTQPQWGEIRRRMEASADAIRRFPMSTITLALAASDLDDQKVKVVRPSLYGGIVNSIGQFYSAVGFAMKSTREGGLQYGIRFDMPSTHITKPAPRFPRWIVNTETPGETTLGSLILSAYPNANVPHYEHDAASYVSAEALKAQTPAKVPASDSKGSIGVGATVRVPKGA